MIIAHFDPVRGYAQLVEVDEAPEGVAPMDPLLEAIAASLLRLYSNVRMIGPGKTDFDRGPVKCDIAAIYDGDVQISVTVSWQ